MTSGPAGRPLKVFLVACEDSGDALGAALMQGLATRAGRPVTFAGVGGHAMADQGLHSLFPIGDLAIVGIDAVLKKLPMILRHIRETAAAVLANRPDVLVIIDSPDFTHRVARKVRAASAQLPIINYVSPSVWAWRPRRARAMRRYVDHVLALLPFEPAAHMQLGGPACSYVGHPLSEIVTKLRPGTEEQRRRDSSPPVLLVLPGSRSGEVTRLLGPFGDAVHLVAERVGPVDVVVPTVPRLALRVSDAVKSWSVRARVVIEVEEKWAAFRMARAALAASGTVTLELALAAIPTVVAYKVSLLEEMIARFAIRTPSIVLANLVLAENVMPEILQRAATPERLAEALVPLLQSSSQRERQLAAFQRIDAIMDIGRAVPSARAADIVLAAASKGRAAVATAAPIIVP
jgi:lipid-A-disaccharide synthase